jgi:hypothetical protein
MGAAGSEIAPAINSTAAPLPAERYFQDAHNPSGGVFVWAQQDDGCFLNIGIRVYEKYQLIDCLKSPEILIIMIYHLLVR